MKKKIKNAAAFMSIKCLVLVELHETCFHWMDIQLCAHITAPAHTHDLGTETASDRLLDGGAGKDIMATLANASLEPERWPAILQKMSKDQLQQLAEAVQSRKEAAAQNALAADPDHSLLKLRIVSG